MENRAWRGIRLVTEPIEEGDKIYVYTIGWHIPIGMFYLEEEVTYPEGIGRPFGTYGKIIAYSSKVKPLIRHIEKLRKVKIRLDRDITRDEEYDIQEGRKILEKHPSWKLEPDYSLVIEAE